MRVLLFLGSKCCHANKYENTNLDTCEHDGFHAW